MSHAFALVIVPVSDITDLKAITGALGLLLEPGNENTIAEARYAAHPDVEDTSEMPGYDPRQSGWWDYWRVGGRWDGVVQGSNRMRSCEWCSVPSNIYPSSDHHFSIDHEQLVNNVAWVRDLGEFTSYTTVNPEGEAHHRATWFSDPSDLNFPWRYADDEGYARWSIEQRIKYRNLVAVGVDYHS